jgi:hypothetical protein
MLLFLPFDWSHLAQRENGAPESANPRVVSRPRNRFQHYCRFIFDEISGKYHDRYVETWLLHWPCSISSRCLAKFARKRGGLIGPVL